MEVENWRGTEGCGIENGKRRFGGEAWGGGEWKTVNEEWGIGGAEWGVGTQGMDNET